MSEMLGHIRDSIIKGEIDKAVSLTREAVDGGIAAETILYEATTPAMEIVGQEYESDNIFLPEMLMSSEVVQNMMKILNPVLSKASITNKGKVVIGTVQGDIHNIGKDIVGMMLEGSGFKIVNLGVDVPAKRFVEKVAEEKPDILGMSALLSTTALGFADVMKALEEAGLRGRVKVMIGGSAASQKLADSIGADGFGSNAGAAVRLANSFVNS